LELYPDNTAVFWTVSLAERIRDVFRWKISNPDNEFCIEPMENKPFGPFFLLSAPKWKIHFIAANASIFPWEVLDFSTWLEKNSSIEYKGGVLEFPAQEVSFQFVRANLQQKWTPNFDRLKKKCRQLGL
jgi:hypothetical protein